jgi:hypothetical protein
MSSSSSSSKSAAEKQRCGIKISRRGINPARGIKSSVTSLTAPSMGAVWRRSDSRSARASIHRSDEHEKPPLSDRLVLFAGLQVPKIGVVLPAWVRFPRKSRYQHPYDLPTRIPTNWPDTSKTGRTATLTKMQFRPLIIEENERWRMRADARLVPLDELEASDWIPFRRYWPAQKRS